MRHKKSDCNNVDPDSNELCPVCNVDESIETTSDPFLPSTCKGCKTIGIGKANHMHDCPIKDRLVPTPHSRKEEMLKVEVMRWEDEDFIVEINGRPIGACYKRQDAEIIKGFLKGIEFNSFLDTLLKQDREELVGKIEAKRKDIYMEEKMTDEEKELCIKLFGPKGADTPSHLIEKRAGYNWAIDDILSIIKE